MLGGERVVATTGFEKQPGTTSGAMTPTTPDTRISVSGICTNGLSLNEDIDFWRRHGIRNVGVPRRKLTPEGISRLRSSDLRVTSLLGFGPRLDEPSGWSAARRELRAMFAEAEAIGTETIVITSGPAGALEWEDAAESLADVLEPIRHEAPVPLLIEHTNQLRTDISFVCTLRDAVDLARKVGLGVVLETNACWMERSLKATIRDGVDLIGLVHVSDCMPGVRRTPDRAVPGDGIIPLPRIIADLFAAGYGGVFELEFVGPRIEEEGYHSAVRRSIGALEDLLAHATPPKRAAVNRES